MGILKMFYACCIFCINLELKLEEIELTNEKKICVIQLTFCIWALSSDVKATGMSFTNASTGGQGDNCMNFLGTRE